MGVITTEQILYRGVVKNIGDAFGSPDAEPCYAGDINQINSSNVIQVDNSATGNTHTLTLLGAVSGTTFDIDVDETSTFFDKDLTATGVVTALTAGDILYGTNELLEVVSVVASASVNTTYAVEPVNGSSDFYVLVECGLLITG